ncbi:MAG: hypothetical protein Q9P14_13970 [candidate division KSB1 bacterium]|nr:hypothetical protein [candidate division KSB1 bacterium]
MPSPANIKGIWSLWRISISMANPSDSDADNSRYRIFPFFLADDGRVFPHTARHIWNLLLTSSLQVLEYMEEEDSLKVFEQVQKKVEQLGKVIYDELVQMHQDRLTREYQKIEYSFAARRRGYRTHWPAPGSRSSVEAIRKGRTTIQKKTGI